VVRKIAIMKTLFADRHPLVPRLCGSAWEPNELQALPAETLLVRRVLEAEPGNEHVRGGDQREVSL
jgi:hypothetical protein